MAKKSNKDQERAKQLKALGIERTTSRCPICYKQVSLSQLGNHFLSNCKGKERRYRR